MDENKANVVIGRKYLPAPEGKPSSKGYASDKPGDSRELIPPSYVQQQSVVDYNTSIFKYGDNTYQDPLLIGFDIKLDYYNSPLFKSSRSKDKKSSSLVDFLNDYGDISSMSNRKDIYDKFVAGIMDIFDNRAYYINSISGLDKLQNKITEYGTDKLTFVLNDDISMVSRHLAMLYNNLAYSYKGQRFVIPANLLRFDMYIKFSDIRNMINDDGTYDKSYIIYNLKDCNFNFFGSRNFDESVKVGGFESSVNHKPSELSFDVIYKSVDMIMNPLLVSYGSVISNKDGEDYNSFLIF